MTRESDKLRLLDFYFYFFIFIDWVKFLKKKNQLNLQVDIF